jgi:hypothetical protein
MRCLEGLAMREDAKSFLGRIGPLARSQLATQAAVLLPVIVAAGLSAWTLRAPPRADSQSARVASFTAAQEAVLANASPASVGTDQPGPPKIPPAQVAPIGASSVAGLWISSQSWRRGGLGSNALVTLTLRNENDYAVKDVEIACVFSRSDGTHLTDRKRVIPDTVNMKSRKIFAHFHIGFVNIYANKAKCVPVAASRT